MNDHSYAKSTQPAGGDGKKNRNKNQPSTQMPGPRGASAPDKRRWRRRRRTHPGNNSGRRILYVYAWASSGCYWSPAVCRWDVNTVSFNGKLQSIAAAVSRRCEGGRKGWREEKEKGRQPAVIKSAHAGGGHSSLWNIVTGINSWVKSVSWKRWKWRRWCLFKTSGEVNCAKSGLMQQCKVRLLITH